MPSQVYERYQDVRAICITGEEGIGKSSLAHVLYGMTREDDLSKRFDHCVHVTISRDASWESVLTGLARQVLGEPLSHSRIEDIENDLLHASFSKKYLLVLDHADSLRELQLPAFLMRWIGCSHRSLILLTSRTDPMAGYPSDDRYLGFELGGIAEEFVVRELLGSKLVEVIEEHHLWPIIARLGNNPQKLLFLRWRALRDSKSIELCVDELTRDADESGLSGVNAIETVMEESSFPLPHFRALGRLRVSEFPESLFAFLWDRLGGGSSEQYAQALDWLGDKRLLVVESRPGVRQIRLSASVQLRLRSSRMEKYFGREGLLAVDYFISQYFLNCFASSRSGPFRTDYLEEYAYHSIQCGHLQHVYAYLVDNDILDASQYRGSSIGMVPILAQMVDAWMALSPRDDEEYLLQGARLRLALAFAHNDLTRHDDCLSELHRAEALIEKVRAIGSTSEELVLLERRIWHCRGISYSQTGRIGSCIDSYGRLVILAAQGPSNRGRMTWFDILTLGYIAYELKFVDMDRALQIGERAVELSRLLVNDRNTHLKNLNSLGQIYFYAGRVADAQAAVRECEDLLLCLRGDGTVDQREIGRVLVNAAPVHIHIGGHDYASDLLRDAEVVTQAVGDKRRHALSLSYQALISAAQGNKNLAVKLTVDAVNRFWQSDAFREALYGTFNLALWTSSGFDGNVTSLDAHLFDYSEAAGVSHGLERLVQDSRSEVFSRYWRDCYRPRLLQR